jgi:MFS family permease
MVLGLGWSATMVAGSTLLSDSISVELRPSAQGLSDLMMGLAGATAGDVSGVIVDAWGYSTLTLLAALATAPLIVLVLFSTARDDGSSSRASSTGASKEAAASSSYSTDL